MAIEVKFPSVGESITSGVLGAWLKPSGEYVETGDAVAEIETDKVTSEVFAEAGGVLKHAVEQGAAIEVGQVIGTIDEKATKPAAAGAGKEKEAAPAKPKREAAAGAEAPAAPKAARHTEPSGIEKGGAGGAGVMDRLPIGHSTPPAGAAKAPETEGKAEEAASKAELLSPAVRALLDEHGLDFRRVRGTGKDGRILKSDVLAYLAEAQRQREQPSGPAPAAASAAPMGERQTRRRMTPLRKRIAERLVMAQQNAALLTTFNEVDMTQVIALRKQFQERFTEKHEVKLGFMSLFVKASVYALRSVPALNAQIDGDEIVQHHFYDIGVAISTEKGLLVPVLRGCDQMGLAEIEKAIIEYSKKARSGKITLPDLEGGVFTITNGGIFGSMLSTPLLNPPQSGILGMHAITERPMAVNGRVEVRPMMYVALTYDHRIVDGKEAVTFLVRLKEAIENPAVHLLGL